MIGRKEPLKIVSTAGGSDGNWNWSSFQLANSTPPLSVTGSAIAPSARMLQLPLGSPDCGILARTHGISTHYPRECAWVAFHMCITAVQDPAPGVHTVSNLPGWRWATIMQVVLDRLSRSLHSDVCDSDGCRDAVAHSRISGRGSRRANAAPNHFKSNQVIAYGIRGRFLRPGPAPLILDARLLPAFYSSA